MIKVVNPFSYIQRFVPRELSALSSGLYTCIKWCNFGISSLKPLEQFSPDFTWGPCVERVLPIFSNGYAPLNKMAAMPIYRKIT